MKFRVLALAFAALIAGPAVGQDKEKNDVKPILRLEAGGPTSNVTALAFSPDGKTLYAAGFDKVVRGYVWNSGKKAFELNDALAFRVPIGPGIDGAINSIAISDDGQWLAVGGFGVISEGMKFNEGGKIIPTLGGSTPATRADRGQIIVYNTRDRSVKNLRGHSGPVFYLKFNSGEAGRPLLVSAAESWNADASKARGEAIVWDLQAGKATATHAMPFPELFRRPGVELSDARAFLAWEDGVLTRWNWPRALDVMATPSLKYNTSLDRHEGRILMTGLDGSAGALQEFTVDGQAGPKFHFPRPAAKEGYVLPLAVRFINGGKHAAAVLSRYDSANAPTNNTLSIVAMQPEQGFGRQVASLPLGGPNRIVPILGVSRTHIAVGGFPDHRIMVFPIADAIGGAAEPQILRGVGATIRWAQFVKKGDARGIAISETLQTTKADAVFDLANGKLVDDVAAWQSETAVPGEYRVGITAPKAPAAISISLAKGNQTLWNRPLKEGNVTATAVLPPIGEQIPLVAIASYIPKKATTVLEIANGSTGEILRRFAGHTAPIQSLAFRADGKLLVSAADDQTTIVWSLTDLADVLGKHGSLGFLAVEPKGKDLTIIDTDGVKEFAVGDIVRGIYDKAGKLQPTPTSGAFYEALWMKTPGQNAKVRVSRGGAENDVDVVVHQGTDVRKPLFTLFFPKAADGKLGDWIGWNAIGPYDASRREVEQYLGWHFNTGKADQPTSFAFIDQYRKEYFRPGILKEMAELGDLPPPPKAPPPKQALLVPGISENGQLLNKLGGEYLVRKKTIDLHVTIPNYDPLPGDDLTWQIGNGPAKAFDTADANLWTAAVDVPAGPDPTRRITVRLKRTPEGYPAQEQSADVVMRLVSPPPKITLQTPKSPDDILADKAEFPVAAIVNVGEVGVPYKATISHILLGRLVKGFETGSDIDGKKIDSAFALEPGVNVFNVRAVNVRAIGRPHEYEETALTTIKVLYEPRKSPPPVFTFNRLVPESGVAVPIINSVMSYQSAKTGYALEYTVKSEEPIEKLEWQSGTDDKRRPLDIPAAGKPGTLKLKLAPGTNSIRVFLKAEKQPEVSVEQRIEFRPPPLESLRIVNLEDGFRIVGDGDRAETPLEVQFSPLALEYKLPVKIEAAVFSGGKKVVQETAVVDAGVGSAKFAKLPLVPGNNEVQVKLRHDFGPDELVVAANGSFVRPPKIASLVAAPVGKTPFADVTAQVVSTVEPAKQYVNVTVNGRLVRPSAVEVKKGDGEHNWIVEAKQVPLNAAKGKEVKSDIALSLATSDGAARASLKEPLTFALPLPPRPEIVLLEPAIRDVTVSEPVMNFRFKVLTPVPLTRVELVRGDKVLKRWDAVQPSDNGEYTFSLPNVPLDWQINALSIIATNEGGPQTSAININVPPQPVRLEIEQVEFLAPVPGKISPSANGTFAELRSGQVVLHGSVRWNANDDSNLQKAKQVRMFVNGFQQLPVELKPVPGKPRERKFQVPVVLNFNDNEVEVDLPELKQDASNRRKISLACKEPVRGSHLHVLVIAPQEKDEAKLVDSLMRFIKAEPRGQNLYKTDVYDVVRVYTLAKHVQLLEISSRLDRIAEALKERARTGNPNDLVMIYFQGKETVGDRGPVLWTSESAPWLQLTLNDLSKNYLSRFAGGQVIILDTISQAESVDLSGARYAYARRPDPRPLADSARVKFSTELEKGMQAPNVVWFEQLMSILAAQVRPNFQSHTPEPLKGRIQLNPH